MLATSHAELPPVERIGRFTVDQYFEMIKIGIIPENSTYELLDGLIVVKDRSKKGEPLMSIGDDHMLVVSLLGVIGAKFVGRNCFMQIQGPIRLSDLHAPEPDGAIVRGKIRDYTNRPRFASDACSVIEVGDSSIGSDRTEKGPKYAVANIPQFVLIDLVGNTIEVYESPNSAKRTYDICRVAKPGENVDFMLGDGTRLSVPVVDLLP